MIASCIDSGSKILIDHLLVDCNLVSRLLGVFENPFVHDMDNKVCSNPLKLYPVHML
jgi:hypothetical protein